MKNNNRNNNNNMDLIPFDLKSFSLPDWKSILSKYTSSDTLISLYLLHIFDCNGANIGHIEFLFPFKTNSPEEHLEFEIYVNHFYNQIIEGCTWWSNEFPDLLPDSDLFFMHINKA